MITLRQSLPAQDGTDVAIDSPRPRWTRPSLQSTSRPWTPVTSPLITHGLPALHPCCHLAFTVVLAQR